MADQVQNPSQVAPAQTASASNVSPQAAPAKEPNLADLFSSASVADSGASQVSQAPADASAASAASTSATQTSSSQPTAQRSAYLQQAAELGIQVPDTATDAEVFAALTGRMKQMAPYAQFGQSLLPHADEIQEYFAKRGLTQAQQPAAQAASDPQQWSPEQHFKKLWDAPTLTAEMQFAINNGLVERDPDTGLMKSKPGYELMVTPLLSGMNAALTFQRQQWQEIMQSNPYEKFYGALKDPIQRMIDERVQQVLQQRTVQQSAVDGVNEFERANADWLYQKSNTGTLMPTEKGQMFVQLVRQLAGNWTGDSLTLLQLCKNAVLNSGGSMAANQPAATTTASATTAATSNNPSVASAQTPAEKSEHNKKSFLDKALANAAHQPSSGASTVQSPSGPVSVTATELEEMFLADFRAANQAA